VCHFRSALTTTGEAEVQIRITDMNDNVPFFSDRIYTARVPENTDAGTVVITVTAEDKDEGKIPITIIYLITSFFGWRTFPDLRCQCDENKKTALKIQTKVDANNHDAVHAV